VDIIPENVRNGEDTRTTVLLRNIARACTGEQVLGLLSHIGLSDSYTFFYMPVDEHNMPCGLAYVNFRTPEDVLSLYESMQSSFARTCLKSSQLAVGYSQQQGQGNLIKHLASVP